MVMNLPANARDTGDEGLILGSGRSPGGGAWQPTPVFLPGESHGQKSLVGYSTQSHKESDRTEATYQHTSEIKGLEIYQISPMNYYWFLKPLLFTLAD